MRRSLAFNTILLALAGLLAACSPPPPADSGPGDTGTTTETGVDATVTDSPSNPDARDARADGGPDGGGCRMLPIEQLSTVGMTTGATTRFSGSNATTPDSLTAGLQPPAGSTVCDFRTTHQRVFQYNIRTRSALRISTSNPGTNFDTTIIVFSSCATTGRALYCNDDDSSLTPATGASKLLTDVREMGTSVFIGVGGFTPTTGMRNPARETGTFELTIEEVAPLAVGMPCDVRGVDNACDTTGSCVGTTILADTGTCRALGTVAGARCTVDGTCTGTGLTCDSMAMRCYETVADAMPCQRFIDARQRCGVDSSCVNLQRGGIFGTCHPRGSIAGAACNAANMCPGTGLSCQTTATGSICLLTAATGSLCRTWDTLCPATEQCLSADIGGTPGTCRPLGSAAGTDCMGGTTCASTPIPLSCGMRGTAVVCLDAAAAGAACGVYTQCASMGTCYLTDPAIRTAGTCFTPGLEGGACNLTGTACATGLTCSQTMPTAETPGRCLRTGTVGGTCRVFGTTSCPMGSNCVPASPGSLDGTCRDAGTAAGAPCRAVGMGLRCDGALVCSSATGGGICQTPTTTACDPRWGTNRCGGTTWCQQTSGPNNGTCVTPTMEAEINDAVTMPQMITAPASLRGALGRFDLDCFRLAVPAGQGVFARVNNPDGFCAGDPMVRQLALDLYDSTGRLLGGDTGGGAFGCPRIDGARTHQAWARAATAGNYTVCVRNAATGRAAIDGYVVDIATVP